MKGWGPYLAISVPATIMLIANSWACQVMGVLAGLISINDQAVNMIMMGIAGVIFMVPLGI